MQFANLTEKKRQLLITVWIFFLITALKKKTLKASLQLSLSIRSMWRRDHLIWKGNISSKVKTVTRILCLATTQEFRSIIWYTMVGRTITFWYLVWNIQSWQCTTNIEVHIQEQEQDFHEFDLCCYNILEHYLI